jgi:hypothetical protein
MKPQTDSSAFSKKLKPRISVFSALSGLTSIATPQQMHRYSPQFMASYPSGLSHFTLETKKSVTLNSMASAIRLDYASLRESGRVSSSRAGSGNTTR